MRLFFGSFGFKVMRTVDAACARSGEFADYIIWLDCAIQLMAVAALTEGGAA